MKKSLHQQGTHHSILVHFSFLYLQPNSSLSERGGMEGLLFDFQAHVWKQIQKSSPSFVAALWVEMKAYFTFMSPTSAALNFCNFPSSQLEERKKKKKKVILLVISPNQYPDF